MIPRNKRLYLHARKRSSSLTEVRPDFLTQTEADARYLKTISADARIVPLNFKRITKLGPPQNEYDAVTKEYVDNIFTILVERMQLIEGNLDPLVILAIRGGVQQRKEALTDSTGNKLSKEDSLKLERSLLDQLLKQYESKIKLPLQNTLTRHKESIEASLQKIKDS